MVNNKVIFDVKSTSTYNKVIYDPKTKEFLGLDINTGIITPISNPPEVRKLHKLLISRVETNHKR